MNRRIKDNRIQLGSARGVSLLELILLLAIAGILLGMTAITLTSTINQEGPKALAYSVASDLKSARAEAKRSGSMVAYCLPSDGKTNSFSHDAVLRKGEQRGHIHRILTYGKEYEGAIFAGSWPGSTLGTHDLGRGWTDSTADEMAILFRPDGTAFSNDIPAIDGNYPLLIGKGFTHSSGGPRGEVSEVRSPHTVWVSQAGTVTVDESKVPVGNLPNRGIEPVVATLDLATEPAPTSPSIRKIQFLPRSTVGDDSVGMGQNYVNVHPDQKDTARLEYGIATMLIKATDQDGGPLYFELEGFASQGDMGKFSVSRQSGAMHYVYDPEDRLHYWQSLVSWRPPPGAAEDTEYELRVIVRDEQGNTDSTASGAGLLPVINTLSPVRMVMAARDGNLYLANLEGGSTIKLTDDGQRELNPFFSQDGSRIYSFFHPGDGSEQLRVRNADGSRSYRILRNFSASVMATLEYDPTYQYVAYRDPGSSVTVNYPHQTPVFVQTDQDPDTGVIQGYWEFQDGSDDYTGQTIEVLHLLANDPPITITTQGTGGFFWDALRRHTLVYNQEVVHDTATHGPAEATVNGQPFPPLGDYIPSPGHQPENGFMTQLVGYPPRRERVTGTPVNASSRSYNPADENWFVYHDGSELLLGRRDNPSFQRTIHNGSISGDARWSSNGQQIVYIATDGSGQTVTVRHLLEGSPALVERSNFEIRYSYNGNGLSHAQLDPSARWVFYLQRGELFRAVNADGAARVDLSDQLGKLLDSFAVSP